MAGQPGFFDADERLKVLSAAGDPLVRLAAVVDVALYRGELETALERSDRSKGGRPPYDAVLMFKALVLQTLYTLSDDATAYQLRDRLSFMRQIDRDGRWTLKRGRKRAPSDDGGLRRQATTEIVVPVFGYKNHVGIDRAHGFIRRSAVTDAAAHDGGQLEALLDRDNLASGVWADTAYRSQANLALLDRRGLVAQFQRAKPRGKPMPAHIRRGNATRAKVRATVEHVFAAQKRRLGLIVRTIGLVRATARITLANLAYNMRRLSWIEGRTVPA